VERRWLGPEDSIEWDELETAQRDQSFHFLEDNVGVLLGRGRHILILKAHSSASDGGC
jgi:hypothetical protein